jgi:hypothetical protein
MGIIEEILKEKGELLEKFIQIIEGKETRTKVNLDGISFRIGKSTVRMNGSVEFVFVPIEKKKK